MTGRWSLRAVSQAAGLTESSARSLVRLGYLDPADLHEVDIVTARVAAAVTATPAPGVVRGRNIPVEVSERDKTAVALTRQALNGATPLHALLVVSAEAVTYLGSPAELTALLAELPAQPLLLLPIGTWIAELPSRARTEATPDDHARGDTDAAATGEPAADTVEVSFAAWQYSAGHIEGVAAVLDLVRDNRSHLPANEAPGHAHAVLDAVRIQIRNMLEYEIAEMRSWQVMAPTAHDPWPFIHHMLTLDDEC